MSTSHFRKSPLEDDVMKELQSSSIQFSKKQCSSLKLCPHTPATRSGSIAKIPDDRSSAESRFLNWVAYHRNLAAPSQITNDERLRCPIMWCRRPCHNQNALLEHVFKCAHYSDGRYWCFHCQMEESFSSCQCKHCQAPAFGKERLSVRVKRLLQKLGTKSHQKDHEALNSPSASKKNSADTHNRRSEYLPQYGEVPSMAVEMDIDKVFRELEADCILAPVELNGLGNIPAELDSENVMASTSKQEIPNSRSETRIYPVDTVATGFASMRASVEAVQALPIPTSDIHEPPSRFHNGRKIKIAIPDETQLQLQSPVSPENADWISTSYADIISESPTSTDFSGHSLFTSISPPSTRNTTMQSFISDSLTFDESSDHLSTALEIQDFIKGMPNDIPTKEHSSHGRTSIIQADAFHATNLQDPALLGPRDLLSSNNLLTDFCKVLSLHVLESSARLKMLPDSLAVNELLSMTARMIACTGFEAWQIIHSGGSPSTIVHLYSLVHLTYAGAIVIYDGQVENQLRDLFTQSLSFGTRALSEEDREIYTSIAWSLWSPPLELKGKVPLRPNGNSEGATQSLRLKETPNTLELPLNKDNEIPSILNHFLDIFEGSVCCNKFSSVFGNLRDGFKDENFARAVKENVTNPLIEGHFQPGPSLEAFIKAVTNIDMLVSIGHITTIREVEVSLKWAGKSIAQSMELYRIFSSRVKERCRAAAFQLRLDPTVQIESHTERINAMWLDLEMVISDASQFIPDGSQWYQSEIGLGSSFLTLEQVGFLPGGIVDDSEVNDCAQSITQAGVYRRSAIKRKRPSSSSSSSTPETGPSPSSSASLNTLSESSEIDTCCSLCDFRSKGERKWQKRTMERHIATHDEGHRKVHVCKYERCGRSFTRADNLASHQRNKGHL